MTWTQPCCDDCFTATYPDRTPIRVIDPDTRQPDHAQCCLCGHPTNGLWIRRNPTKIPYPRPDPDE